MDWFRNVPNVIRNQSSTDHSKDDHRSTSEHDDQRSYTSDERSAQTRRVERQPSRDEYGRSFSQPPPLPAPPAFKKNSVKEEILCALCGEIYSDPRLLPCLHSFCKRCLEHTVNPRSTTLTCHLCRKEVMLKINGIAEFPPNFVINNMIDMEAVRNSTSIPMLCSSCNEQLPATARCVDCMDFLCYACHNAHGRVRMTKDHQILTLEQLKRSDDIARLLHRPVFCQLHKDEKVTYFCNTCQTTICRECVITTHQQNKHEYTPIQQAVDSQRNEIISLKLIIEQKLPMLNRATSHLHDTQHKLESRSDLIKSEIEERTPRLIKMIEEKERTLLQDISKVVNEKKLVLNKQLEQLETEFSKLEDMQKFAEQVLSTGTDAEILSIKHAVCEKLKNSVKMQYPIEPEVDDQISCDTNIESITTAIQSYGQLSASGEVFLNCFVLGDVTSAIKGQMSQLTLVIKNQHGVETPCVRSDIDAEIETPEYGILVPDIREKNESTFLLSYRTYSVGLHKLSIKLKNKPILGSPFSVIVSNQQSGSRRGSEPNTSLLKELTIDAHAVSAPQSVNRSPAPSEQRSPPSYSKPLSLDINHYSYKNNEEVSHRTHTIESVKLKQKRDMDNAYLDSKEENNIKISNFHNLRVETVARFMFSIGRRGTQYGEFHGVFGVASDHINKRVIATDCHNNRIQVFDESGKFLFCFGQKGGNDGEFQSPTGVGVGTNGEIVVCERLKGRIQIFNSNGEFQRRFILNQLKASTLAVDISGRIIIADYTNCCVYVLDPILERWSKFGHFGQSEGELQYPCYVATDLKGNIYVSDMNSNKVQMYDSDSMFIRSFGMKGDRDGEFLHPTGIAIDIKGRLIVADRDNHRIQIIKSTGEFYAKFGSKGEHDGELNDTHGLAVLSNGNIAAADLKNNRIQIFSIANHQ